MKTFKSAVSAALLGAATVVAHAACMTDTAQSDFQSGTSNNVDVAVSPGDVVLVKSWALDQQNTTVAALGTPFSTSAWVGQTFTAGLSGRLTRADVNLFCTFCSGTSPTVIVSVRATSGGLPTGADLSSATIPSIATDGSQAYYSAIFAAAATLTAGTQYALVIRPSTNPASGSLGFSRAGTNLVGADVYAGGALVNGASSGTSWSVQTFQSASTSDAGFKTYIQGGYAPSGTWTSPTRDSNPPTGATPAWSTLSWTASTPTGTMLRFQAAASNSSGGPFDFVGPDGTAATFFTSGASLNQFDGQRYLQYRAYLSTTDSTATPTLNDATACFATTSSADLTITNSDGATMTDAGSQITYTITVTDTGPSSIAGAAVTDTFPAALTCAWSCTINGSGQCAPVGWGDIADSINLGSGSSAVYTAVCAIASGTSGMLLDTASVAPPAGVTDPDPNSNSATDTDMVMVTTNVAMALDDGVAFVRQGDVLDYVLELTNANGPADAVLDVADMLPAQLDGGSWVCAGSGNAACSSGSGNTLSGSATVPVGGKVDYVFSATVSAGDGTITNDGSATLQFGTNTPSSPIGASDVDTVVVFRDGFDASAAAASLAVTDTGAGAALTLGIDSGLATTLSLVPVTVATGQAASGRVLFRLQAMRLGNQTYLRALPAATGKLAAGTVPSWRNADLRGGVLALEWQAATAGHGDGRLAVAAGGTRWEVGHGVDESLDRLQVALAGSVPWLVRLP